MFAVEDLISDYVDLKVSVRGQVLTEEMIYSSLGLGHTFQPTVKVHKLVGLSVAMTNDVALFGQIRRKIM